MVAHTLALAVLKRRAVMRTIVVLASIVPLVFVMAMCGTLAVFAIGSAGTQSTCAIYDGANARQAPTVSGARRMTPTALTTRDSFGKPLNLTAAQLSVAQDYVSVGNSLGVPITGQEIAIMMALQESGLKVLANPAVPESLQYPHDGLGSDHDSLGTAQQRPSSGWGSPGQLMDPIYDARAFYGGSAGPNKRSPPGLLDIAGWQFMAKGQAAQAVQRSAFPELYAQWETSAVAIVNALADGRPEQCSDSSLTAPVAPVLSADLSQVRKDLIRYAEQGVGGAYVWGGTEFKAWDCSGYVRWVFAQAGVELPRTEQWLAGKLTTNPQPGDLVVQNPDGPNHWGHVGIYAGNGMMYSALNPAVGTLLHPVSWNAETVYFDLLA